MSAVLHLSLTETQTGHFQFRFWAEKENTATTRDLALAEIQDLASHADTYYYTGRPDLTVGQRLFRWLDGPDRALSRAIAAARHGSGPLVLAIHAAQGLAHLPWETLADDDGFLVSRANPAVVPARWHGRTAPAWDDPRNRPLHTLFMAAAPEGSGAPLDFEVEEGRMFQAAEIRGRRHMDLTVEESGCLADLGELVSLQEPGTFDVFHLTGHAGHEDTTPVFMLECDIGTPAPATAAELAKAFAGRLPRLAFLSGCRTAESPGKGAEQSLAATLVEMGVPAVLGWGRPVRDDHAILAAEMLYHDLAVGHSLPAALSRTWQGMIEAAATSWHLLRLHFDGAVPGPLVTAPASKGRAKPIAKLPSEHFLIPGDVRTRVPGLDQFVGRRRLLQRGIRLLRTADSRGIVLHGTGGLGKSSVVSRWADRLRADFLVVPIFGLCDEFTLTRAFADALPHQAEAERQALQGQGDLYHRLAAALESCEKPVLFVLDDFEQNQDAPYPGEPHALLKPEAAPVFAALHRAVGENEYSRLLITTRYPLPAASVSGMEQIPITPMDAADQTKRLSRLAAAHPTAARQPATLRDRATSAAGGNHRLLEWLYKVLDQSGLDHPALLAAMEAKEAEFRENILAAALCAALPAATRTLLTALLICEEPIPLPAVAALALGLSADTVTTHIATAVAWGLAYVWEIEDQPHWLAAPFLRPLLGEPPAEAAPAVLAVLQNVWWDDTQSRTTARVLELHRLAVLADNLQLACNHAAVICAAYLKVYRAQETVRIAEMTLASTGVRDTRILTSLARALEMLGGGKHAINLFAEINTLQADACMDENKAITQFHYANLLIQQHYSDQVLRQQKIDEADAIYRLRLLPYFSSLGEPGRGPKAVVMGKIADILVMRGNLDDALHLLQNELIPEIRSLNDSKALAITQGQIADIFRIRRNFKEALRIRREVELPAYDEHDVRSLSVVRYKIAETLLDRGDDDDKQEIATLLSLAWSGAKWMGLPEAGLIEETARQNGLLAEVLAQAAQQI